MPVRELLENPGFRTGIGVGLVVLVITLVALVAQVALVARAALAARVAPIAAIAVVVAATGGLRAADAPMPGATRLLLGLALLLAVPMAVAAALGHDRRSGPAGMLAAVPGAALVASAASVPDVAAWVPWAVFGATVVGGAMVTDFDGANRAAGLGPVLLAVAVLGMYSTLPDTEQVVVVVGAVLPLALLGMPVAVASFGAGAYGIVGLVGWVAAVGGRGRPGSVVAAIACLGLMLVEPVVRRTVRGRLRAPTSPRSAVAAGFVVVQVPLVLVIARVAGLRTSGLAAAALSALALVTATVVGVVLHRAHRDSAPLRPQGDDRRGRSPS
ncbi:MAG: hypothetical protein ACKOA9_13285 [Actinomycetota bacterium]